MPSMRDLALAASPRDLVAVSKFFLFHLSCTWHQINIQWNDSNKVTPLLPNPQRLPIAS